MSSVGKIFQNERHKKNVKEWGEINHVNSNHKKGGMVTSEKISDKIDFKRKKLVEIRTFYNNERVNLLGSYNKHICNKQQSNKIHEVETDKNEGRIYKSKIIIGDFNYPLSIMDRTRQEGQLYTTRNRKKEEK